MFLICCFTTHSALVPGCCRNWARSLTTSWSQIGFTIFILTKLAVEPKFRLTQSKVKPDRLPQRSFEVEQILRHNCPVRKARHEDNRSSVEEQRANPARVRRHVHVKTAPLGPAGLNSHPPAAVKPSTLCSSSPRLLVESKQKTLPLEMTVGPSFASDDCQRSSICSRFQPVGGTTRAPAQRPGGPRRLGGTGQGDSAVIPALPSGSRRAGLRFLGFFFF